jgi:serine/threonine protein phosphatase 1
VQHTEGLNSVWAPRSAPKTLATATLPDGIRIYAIGDIHGRSDLLQNRLTQIEADCEAHPYPRSIIVFLGDYIDRGPASKQVIDLLIECKQKTESIFLKGNHETFEQRFLNDPNTLDEWRSCGGLETLVSYGLNPPLNPDATERTKLAHELADAMGEEHLEFIKSLELSFCCGDFLFVHAGIRPGIPLHKQKEDDLLWIRDEFLTYARPFEKFVVHGHTPVRALDIRNNRANLDTGAFATGHLACVAIENTNMTPLSDSRDWGRAANMDTRMPANSAAVNPHTN